MALIIDNIGPRAGTSRPRMNLRQRPTRAPPQEPEEQAVAPPPVEPRGEAAEQLRAEIAALNQAVQATEQAIGAINAARSGILAVKQGLNALAQAARAGPGEDPDWEARQEQAAEVLAAIDQVAQDTRFGEQGLLDGSLGCTGESNGDALAFVQASPRARSSPPEGFPVLIHQEATRAVALGEVPLSPALVSAGIALCVETGELRAEYRTRSTDSPEQALAELRRRILASGQEVSVQAAYDGRLLVQQEGYGSAHVFQVSSSVPGVLSSKDGRPRRVDNGRDVAGTINGEPARGDGQFLTGLAGNAATDGLCIHYTGPPGDKVAAARPGKGPGPALAGAPLLAGSVFLAQHGLRFRLSPTDPHLLTVRVDSMRPVHLARGVENPSGFQSLADVRLTLPRGAEDAARLIVRAQEDVKGTQERLVGLVEGDLTAHLAALCDRTGQLADLPPRAWAPEKAQAVALSVSERLRTDRGLALSAQSGTPPGPLMRLLSGDEGAV